jgi:hypothetical protein
MSFDEAVQLFTAKPGDRPVLNPPTNLVDGSQATIRPEARRSRKVACEGDCRAELQSRGGRRDVESTTMATLLIIWIVLAIFAIEVAVGIAINSDFSSPQTEARYKNSGRFAD